MSNMEDEYDFSHPERGVAVIINNEAFSTPGQEESDDRAGSSYDAEALDTMFTGLGFKVHRYDNLTSSAMVETLTAIADMEIHSKSDCFACAILSHGGDAVIPDNTPGAVLLERQDYVLGVDGGVVLVASIISIFSDTRCPGLVGKPRLFFFQACRGTNMDSGVGVKVRKTKVNPDVRTPREGDGAEQTDHKDAEEGNVDIEDSNVETNYDSDIDNTDSITLRPVLSVSPSNINKDILVMYATPPGFYAWRRDTGAWFTQSLRTILTPYNATYWSLTTLLTHVNKRVAVWYESSYPGDTSMNEKKQVPCITHMLTKDVYFRPKNMKHSTLV
ncbi:caspase-3-like [Haliotis rufescens]|uniref:caspase-3-like n=1 Tax=Haliotis rufescens TaxID=6454 RepID=UPI00201EA775|nr:caspase-3-like [Haliotis rufescens]XP_048248460.1 caspase-3-like [Haliotis rufescens]